MSRKMVYCPTINSSTFVLLFTKGSSGDSWSVRDYSDPSRVSVRYAHEFPLPLDDLMASAVYGEDAPARATGDLAFWSELTWELNRRFLPGAHSAKTEPLPIKEVRQFPVLDQDRLLLLPKSLKAEDMRRICTSPQSEDWVTWNAFTLAEQTAGPFWWSHLITLAREGNPSIALPPGGDETPTITLWDKISSPVGYENASRERLRVSSDEKLVRRSVNMNPVEGDSEIDVIFRNAAMTVFVEAKLGSDVSMRTTYDATRNQIVRNIDCLLDVSEGTVPMFWMMVRDRGKARSYVQLLRAYRTDIALLVRELPHRDPRVLQHVANCLSLVLWSDFAKVIRLPPDCSPLVQEVYAELLRRIA